MEHWNYRYHIQRDRVEKVRGAHIDKGKYLPIEMVTSTVSGVTNCCVVTSNGRYRRGKLLL